MADKKEETKAAAERIKAQTLTAAKGLSRTQAERAATAAARNVNAYGQKEEGPSRWQEKREAKRQMYLSSTEKAVKLGERKSAKHTMSTLGTPSQCQQCFQPGHWTYECKNERVYIARPSRTQQLKNPMLMMRPSIPYELDNPDIGKEAPPKEKRSKKSKRKHKEDSGSGSDSEDSIFKTDSDSSSAQSGYSSEGSSSESSDTDSEEERRRRRRRRRMKKKQRKQKKRSPGYSSSSESSESDSDEDDRKSRKKSKRHSRRR